MKVSILVLRRCGVRLRRSQLAPALRGELRIGDFDAAHNRFGRHVRIAEIWSLDEVPPRPLGSPIFDPVITRTFKGGFVLSGIEVVALDGGGTAAEYVQLWWCRPVAALAASA